MSKSNSKFILIGLFVFISMMSLSAAASIESNESTEEDRLLRNYLYERYAPYPMRKRSAIDKYRYFGGIGKRSSGTDDYLNEKLLMDYDTTIDRMKNVIGKRSLKFEKQNNLMKKSRSNQIDKYRYLGSIGK